MASILPSSDSKRLLVCYAHPDDETFGLGGTILHYTRRGVEVSLICATDGDAGTVPPERLQGYASVGELRRAELACAAERLGIREVILFGYRDSGMMGTPDNRHPDCLWQAPQDDVARRIVEVIRRVRPQVVITFDPYGGYGHPDHIAMHRATVQAFHAAGNPEKYPEQLDNGLMVYQPQRLYFDVFPRLFIRLGVLLARLTGQDPRHMGRNKDLDFQAVLDATLPAHVRLDLRRYYDELEQADGCHASQVSPRQMMRLPTFLARQTLGWESFFRAWPEVQPGARLERDLFEGVVP
jgi:mycothiol S-conjugate amidase